MSETPALPARSELLILEDDLLLRRRLAARLRQAGAEVTEAGTVAEARRLARDVPFDFAALDLHLPDGSALDVLRASVLPETACCVVMTAFGGVAEAVEAMRLGAADYLAKPFEPDELVLAFQRARRQDRAQRREEHHAGPSIEPLFFGESLAGVRHQLDTILTALRRLDRRLPPVLIEGETGTGKTVLARWLHQQGPRAAQPFIAINCATLPDALAEAELFGHERGAFTDARRARIGLLEAADGGTVLLDEIGTLAPATQAKLLSVVETGLLRRLGANREIAIDVHLLAAGNRPLTELVAAGTFREDLFHRLNLLHIRLPPLRERGGDLVALARHLLKPLAARHQLKALTLSPAGEARLLARAWPGNIRELAHELERAVIFANGAELDLAHLGEAAPGGITPPWRNPAWRLPESGFALDEVVESFVEEALRETGGNVSAAARRLGVTREFLRYRLDKRSPSTRVSG